MRIIGSLVIFILALCAHPLYAAPQYLTCERDADCWTLVKESEWCDTVVSCQRGRCTTVKHGPCNDGLEKCNLEHKKCDAKYCVHDSSCVGGYCDEYRMRCQPGARDQVQRVASTSNGNQKASNSLPGDQPFSFVGTGALTYYAALGGAGVFAILMAAASYICCIM